MSRRLYCACGCGEPLVGKRRHARYLDGTHRKRANRSGDRAAESVTAGDSARGPAQPLDGRQRAFIDPQLTPGRMQARLEALAREFDARGSTLAMRKEGRALAKALGQERPRWIPRDEF